jgi:4,5:9,10-diseco-3-hydroxy-5,9,17-trioxoandrosta-1(10),2-diene-4-oate hydrolase
VEVDGVRLAFNDEGSGEETLVCLHAVGHGARDYEAVRRRFRTDFRVVAIDWPGHGRSAVDRMAFSLDRYADLLEGLLEELGIGRSIIVGNSIGGSVGLIYAARRADRVRALILEDTGGLVPIGPVTAAAMRAMSGIFEAGERGAPWFEAFFAGYYRLLLPASSSSEQRARIIAAGRESCLAMKEAWRSFATPASDLRALATTVRAPILALWAKNDRINPLALSVPALRRIPEARLERVAGGHCPHMETPEEFEAIVRRFLSDRLTRPSATTP